MASFSELAQETEMFEENEQVSVQTEESDITKNNYHGHGDGDDDQVQGDAEDAESSTDDPVGDWMDDPMVEDSEPEFKLVETSTGFLKDIEKLETTGNMWPEQSPEMLEDNWWSFQAEEDIMMGGFFNTYIDVDMLNLRFSELDLELEDWEYFDIWNFDGAPMAA